MNEFSPSKKKLKQYVFLLKKKKLFHETYPLQKKKTKTKKKRSSIIKIFAYRTNFQKEISSLLFNVAEYWQSTDTKTYVKKQYLKKTLITRGRRLVSEFMWSLKINFVFGPYHYQKFSLTQDLKIPSVLCSRIDKKVIRTYQKNTNVKCFIECTLHSMSNICKDVNKVP